MAHTVWNHLTKDEAKALAAKLQTEGRKGYVHYDRDMRSRNGGQGKYGGRHHWGVMELLDDDTPLQAAR